jgi:hypothetical protein
MKYVKPKSEAEDKGPMTTLCPVDLNWTRSLTNIFLTSLLISSGILRAFDLSQNSPVGGSHVLMVFQRFPSSGV